MEEKKRQEKLPHETSNEMARTLNIGDWGTIEEVEKMAQMLRNANSREEAAVILKIIREMGYLENNQNPELKPTLSGKSIREIISGRALRSSFNSNAHWKAAANIDTLIKNAIKKWNFELNPEKDNTGLKDRSFYYAPMEHEGRILPVKLTIKEFEKPEEGNRLYSSQVIDHDLD